jgi:hypothetical protein
MRFWNWWNRGYNNTFRLDEERSSSVGLGGNISVSLYTITKQPPAPRFQGLGEDAGNGSLMRLAPVPIFFHASLDLAMEISAESSYTTHPGRKAADACAFLGFVIARAIVRNPKRRDTAASFLDECVARYLNRPGVAEHQVDLQRLLRSAEPFGSKERCWNWRDPEGPYLLETLASRGKSYNGYPVQSGYFGSYSMDGLAIALHSFYHTRSFMAAITRCINCLGDADSTGAICGQMAGAFYGLESIDRRLVQQLNRWDSGEIALRGAMLYSLGTKLSDEAKACARRRLCDVQAAEKEARTDVYNALTPADELATPPVLPDETSASQPPSGVCPILPHGRRRII